MSMQLNRRHAFTLIELLVVVGIIAVLIASTLAIVSRVRKAAYGASTSAQLATISAAIQQYYGDYKAYPGPLANRQLGSFFDPAGVPTFIPNSSDYRYPQAAGLPLTGTINGTAIPSTAFNHITGTQNMILGLLGGLELQTNATTGVPTAFVYNPNDIFPDGKTPGPVGAQSLNPNNPRRQQAYIQVRPGEISLPSMTYNGGTGASFADSANRSPMDAPIPVFLDKYPDPLPILYIRTNAGGQAIVGVRNTDGNGTSLIDPQNTASAVVETPQYDLCQLLDYTLKNPNNANNVPFGVILNSANPYHGLQGLGSQNLGNPSLSKVPGGIDTIQSGWASQGQNGVAYLRDPAFKITVDSTGNIISYDPLASNMHAGVPREKDGFLLITAGPDRAYGTTDDIIAPGSLNGQ